MSAPPRWLLTLPLPPYPRMPIGCKWPWFLRRAQICFFWYIPKGLLSFFTQNLILFPILYDCQFKLFPPPTFFPNNQESPLDVSPFLLLRSRIPFLFLTFCDFLFKIIFSKMKAERKQKSTEGDIAKPGTENIFQRVWFWYLAACYSFRNFQK